MVWFSIMEGVIFGIIILLVFMIGLMFNGDVFIMVLLCYELFIFIYYTMNLLSSILVCYNVWKSTLINYGFYKLGNLIFDNFIIWVYICVFIGIMWVIGSG